MEQTLIEMGAQALKKAALNMEAKEYILQNPQLFQVLKKAAGRYIGGENLEETTVKVVAANEAGYKCSMEYMGENATSEQEAHAATEEFIRIAKEIENNDLFSTISLDLSHIGLGISRELGQSNFARILEAAASNNTEVIISAESITQTDDIMDAYFMSLRKFNNVSITMQTYLYRSQDDFKELIKHSGRIRLVKGAFDTPAHLSMPRGSQLDEAYLDYLDQLLAAEHLCSVATHHDFIQQEALKLINERQASSEIYEFESLFGIQSEQLEVLKNQGYPTKKYFVYGEEWYLYVCNRIAEYPLNIFRALNDIVS